MDEQGKNRSPFDRHGQEVSLRQEKGSAAGEVFPLSCGCSMTNDDTRGSGTGLVRCRHGRTIFAPYAPGVRKQSWEMKEMRTHLL